MPALLCKVGTMTLTDNEKYACCGSMQSIPDVALLLLPNYGQEWLSEALSSKIQSPSEVGEALREAVWQAQEQGRLRCGVVDCAQLLEISDPFNVMMCVMPASEPDDVSALIQRTLIKAFCHEYQIRLIKVDSMVKLSKVLQGRAATFPTPPGLHPSSYPHPYPLPHHHHHHHYQQTPRVPSAADMCCVLVHSPESGESSAEEQLVVQHCKAICCNDNFDPTIALPD